MSDDMEIITEIMDARPMFNTCSFKIPIVENKLLTMIGKFSKKTITSQSPSLYLARRGSSQEVIAVNYQAYTGVAAHAIYIIKNEYLKNGWAIFNSNGVSGMNSIINGGNDGGKMQIWYQDTTVSYRDITQKHMSISPKYAINTGSDTINPGFCGIFGIIFLCYYYYNRTNSNWVERWKTIIAQMEGRKPVLSLDPKDAEDYRITCAQNVLQIINRNGESDPETAINEIYLLTTGANSSFYPPPESGDDDDVYMEGAGKGRKKRNVRDRNKKSYKYQSKSRSKSRSKRRGKSNKNKYSKRRGKSRSHRKK